MKGETHTTSQPSPDVGARAPSGPHVSSMDRWLVRKMLVVIGRPPFTFRLWNGEAFEGRAGESVAEITIRDRGALFRLLLNPELYFGELYSQDRVSVKGDLVGFVEAAYRAAQNSAGGRLLKAVEVLGVIKAIRSNELDSSRRKADVVAFIFGPVGRGIGPAPAAAGLPGCPRVRSRGIRRFR